MSKGMGLGRRVTHALALASAVAAGVVGMNRAPQSVNFVPSKEAGVTGSRSGEVQQGQKGTPAKANAARASIQKGIPETRYNFGGGLWSPVWIGRPRDGTPSFSRRRRRRAGRKGV